jgi:hypothetical protein
MPISFGELQDAFLFVSFGAPGENEAYLDRPSGRLYYHSAYGDNEEELPDDIDNEKYVAIPHKNELGLGTRLVFAFVREFLSDDYDEVRRIFSRSGAYGLYKAMLVRRAALDRWYDFSNTAEETALREWCAENEIGLSD